MQCRLLIDENPFEFNVNGEFAYGPDQVLFNETGVLEKVEWKDRGFNVIDLFNDREFEELRGGILKIMNRIFQEEGLPPLTGRLSEYHHVINTQQLHQKVISRTRFLTARDFTMDLNSICERISRHLGKTVTIENPKLDEEIIILRISRPDSMDINPLHRDGYLDIWADTLNVWLPIAGCNQLSSLPLIPGSHYWNESEVLRTAPKGASIGELTYHVPGIVKGPVPLQSIRPDPQNGQALLFSPFLVHGAAINQNKDLTRMSLELRLCLAE